VEVALRSAGFTIAEMEQWSWPKFYQRGRLVEERDMQLALLTSRAVWQPQAVVDMMKGKAVSLDPEDWQPTTLERLKKQMEAEED